MVHFYWFSLFCSGDTLQEQCTRCDKIGVISSPLHDARIQTSWISWNVLWGQNSIPTTERFRENWDVTRGKLWLQHVPATCPRNMSPQHVPRNMSPQHVLATCPLVCAGLNMPAENSKLLKFFAWLSLRKRRTALNLHATRGCSSETDQYGHEL